VPTSGIRIGRIFGIPIYLHSSWFIIFALITYSLAGQFASDHPDWTQTQHWTLGLLTSLLFFGSVLFHELAHSVVALRYKIPVVSITLFVFGGVARIGREATTAKQEFNIAVAGPLSSYLLTGGFWLLTHVFPSSEMVGALAGWLWWINIRLATFNLVPGFPLDGGRIFRAIVWGVSGNFERSTRIAAGAGKLIAYGMILFGGWRALSGNLVGGLWLAFIGWFLLTAAQESVAQVEMRGALAGLRAGDIMLRELPTVERSISLGDYVQELLRTGRRCHLVVDGGQLVGLMSIHALNKVPRDEWDNTSVQAAMVPREKVVWSRTDEPALSLLERMMNQDVNQMPVVENGQVVGLVTRDALLRMIQTRTEVGQLARQ